MFNVACSIDSMSSNSRGQHGCYSCPAGCDWRVLSKGNGQLLYYMINGLAVSKPINHILISSPIIAFMRFTLFQTVCLGAFVILSISGLLIPAFRR